MPLWPKEVFPPPIYDEHVRVITVGIHAQIVPNVLQDGGSGVNVLFEAMFRQLGLAAMKPAPFAVKMADQRRVHPLVLARHLHVCIAEFLYTIATVVLRMEDIQSAYPLLLGRPW